MRIVKGGPFDSKNAVAIGTFDGLHKAHQQIIDKLKEEAARLGGPFYGIHVLRPAFLLFRRRRPRRFLPRKKK